MSWREILGASSEKDPCAPQKSQNPRNSAHRAVSADTADCAHDGSTEACGALVEAIGPFCKELAICPEVLVRAVAVEDLVAWRNGELDLEYFQGIATAIARRGTIDKGLLPKHYIHRAECSQCGPVWLGFPGKVLACPWCLNREIGHPIPRPAPVDS